MSSDTDSSSSDSEEKYRKHKSSKKSKSHKKEKKKDKKKKHKKEKRQKSIERTYSQPEQAETDTFGPALPPHMLKKETVNKIIGPTLPADLRNTLTTAATTELEEEYAGYGPQPLNAGLNATQIELEKRALELKLAAIEGRNTSTIEAKEREEWMLELPSVGLRGGLAALATMKRTFHQGKERPDFTDRSDWTKTPQSEANDKISSKINAKSAAEQAEREAQAEFVRKRDEEQEAIAKSHKRKQKHEQSLVDLHQKKLRKKQKKKEKELKKSGAKPERRAFTRDVDLKLNKIDSHQTKQIVDKAKILHDKFSTGKAKYL